MTGKKGPAGSMAPKLAIIDYGLGNLHSVHKAFQRVAVESGRQWQVVVTQDPSVIKRADKVVFPGVGAIRDCMGGLEKLCLKEALNNALETKPVLAICVGMQALMSRSEENGGIACLNWMPGVVQRFTDKQVASHDTSNKCSKLKIPHMGWNQVVQTPHPFWAHIPNQSRFYFVHSYYVPVIDSSVSSDRQIPTLGVCQYGVDFSAVIGKDNWIAVQFHPEKSHQHGLQLLSNFLNWNP